MKRILFADDCPILRAAMRRVFEQNGWTCTEAVNGHDAITKAQEFTPDIIVLDFLMPVMNGLAAAKLLSQVVPQTPLILFTVFGGILNSEEVRHAGFSVLIDKKNAGDLMGTAQTLLGEVIR